MKIAEPTDARPRRTFTVRQCARLLRERKSTRMYWPLAGGTIPRRGSTSLNSGFLAGLATVTAVIVSVSAVGGAGLYDSGWSVAKPSTALDEHATNDPGIRIAISQVLEQSQVPLLSAPAQNASPPI